MNFLFFDIECANCNDGKGKICSFGYCLCTQNFDIIAKEDILINPNAPFCLVGARGNREYVTLAYTEEEFLNSPDFPNRYDKIKELMTRTDTYVIGHAVGNDVNFLISECERYNLPIFSYNFYDMQEVYRVITKAENSKGLSAICAELNISLTVLHRSDEDAFMTMQVAQKLCKDSNMTLEQLLNKHAKSKGDVQAMLVRRELKRQARSFCEFIKELRITQKLKGMEKTTFCFSKKLERKDYSFIAGVVQEIVNRGGYYVFNAKQGDYYVIDKSLSEGKPKVDKTVKVVDIGELLELLGLKRQDIIPINTDTYVQVYGNYPKREYNYEYKVNSVNTIGDILKNQNSHKKCKRNN